MPRCPVLFACLLLAVAGGTSCDRRPTGADTPPSSPSQAPGSVAALPQELSAEFLRLMNAGRNHLQQGLATNALASYRQALALVPHDTDVHLNLANAHLLAGEAEEAIREADEALKLSPNSAAAYFIKGSASLRLLRAEDAVKALENVRALDPSDTATCFQLGRARMELQQWDAAIAAFKEGLALEPNRLHTTAHYLLAQSYLRAGRAEEGKAEIQQHQAGLDAGGNPGGTASFERSKFTQARVPFVLEQPEAEGIPVRFVEVSRETLGEARDHYSGPVGVVDVERSGWPSVLALEPGQGYRWLRNSGGAFRSDVDLAAPGTGGRPSRLLVGDLQNDRFEDMVLLGDSGSQVFRLGTNGQVMESRRVGQGPVLRATDGVLVDLDFTGKLDLVTAGGASGEVRMFRQFGPLAWVDITATSGIPSTLRTAVP